MPQICKQALGRPICMLLGEELGPIVISAVHSTFWWSSVEPTELWMTCTVHINNRVLCIMWTQERLSALEKWFLNSSGWRIYPCACCQYWCQHIFDHHSNIFSADVALDKLCMTSSQKCWQKPKVPQGHWLLTDCSLLCKFYVSFFQMWDLQFSLTWNKLLYHNPLYLLPPFLALTPRSWHQDSSTLSAGNGLWTLSMSDFIYMHDMMQWPNFFCLSL